MLTGREASIREGPDIFVASKRVQRGKGATEGVNILGAQSAWEPRFLMRNGGPSICQGTRLFLVG